MAEKTQGKPTICVICKKPITREQRPAVQIQPGQQAHMECFVERERTASKPN